MDASMLWGRSHEVSPVWQLDHQRRLQVLTLERLRVALLLAVFAFILDGTVQLILDPALLYDILGARIAVLLATLCLLAFSYRTDIRRLRELLNELFSGFDGLSEKYGVEKIKTIGDAYMVVGGVPLPKENHAEVVAEMALDMVEQVARFSREAQTPLNIRIGINTGPAVAGVIGRRKFAYDLWGDTVNTASRMESQGVTG